MKLRGLLVFATLVVVASLVGGTSQATSSGVGNVPQGTQSDRAYAQSVAKTTNVFATAQRTSCYQPEVLAPYSDAAYGLGYDGETACPNGGPSSKEDTGPYPTQAGSNPGYATGGAQLVKDHSESDIRVDPTDPLHLIGSSKWIVSAEGYNHLLGFYESFDGGKTWPAQGHVPGYEGWTDNTDPIGAFTSFGDYYSFVLPYQFFYNADGSHNFTVGRSQEPNPAQPAEAVAVAVRPHGSTSANQWITTVNGKPDFVATYDSVGNEPDKQWMVIDTNPSSPHPNRIYLMWVNFHNVTPVPYISYADALPGGTHTAWSVPQVLPEPPHTATGGTYLLPHVAPNGDVYTTVTNFDPAHSYCCASVFVDKSTDSGLTWSTVGTPVTIAATPPSRYANTTFRDGIENSFAVGTQAVGGNYPLYVAYEDYSAGVDNVLLTASYDGGTSWTDPVQVNDNPMPVDEFQPNLAVSKNGAVSVAWYDRRLACPTSVSSDAAAAGIGLDPGASGASNYCLNSSVQFYGPTLTPFGHNVRLTRQTWDPQLNAPHTSSPTGVTTFIGDYFGNDASGTNDVFTFTSTADDGTNPLHRQQQVVASVAIPTK